MKSTSKIEADYESLLADYLMFCEFEKSPEYKEYHELEIMVNSPTFKQKKAELQHLIFKGSKEEAQLKELKLLSRKAHLQRFYSIQESPELKRFDKISASGEWAHYQKLKSVVKSPTFSSRNKRNEKSEEYLQNAEYHTLKNSDDVKFYEHFQKSAAYKSYLLMKDSPERKRYEELQKITVSDEFKSRVAYLEDKQKWEKTEEWTGQQRFAELNKMPQVVNFLKYKTSDAFDFFRKWELVFEDRFEAGKLDPEKWATQSHWASQSLGRNFSQPGDLQAFTEGENVLLEGKSLKIEVRKEKAKGMQWQIPFGFVEQDFDYTSGLVSTTSDHWWKHGILEAKVKYSPANNLVDAIYLMGEESSPQINLVEMGLKNRLGLLSRSGEGIQADCESISGLASGKFYIFRLEWTTHSLVWKINGKEIFTVNHDVPVHKMHLNVASVVVSEPVNQLPHRLEIDWVRFYKHPKV